MSYGLKCYTGGGYLSFDADQMDSFVRVIVSGSVYLSIGETVTIDAPGFRYVYTFGNTSPASAKSHLVVTNREEGYFQLINLSQATVVGYIAYKL